MTESAILNNGALAPWNRPDADGLKPPHHEPEPDQESYEEDPDAYEHWRDEERREYELAWKAAGAQAWTRAGLARWEERDYTAGGGDLELEEFLETVNLLSNLRHLCVDTFRPRRSVPPALESRHFAPARAIVGRLARLDLERSSGVFPGWLANLPTGPFHLSCTNSLIPGPRDAT